MEPNRAEIKEKYEADKYDRRAENILLDESKGELYVDDIHWKKISNARKPYGQYIGSIKSLGVLDGKRILELGCGTGWLSVIFCKLGATVVGIDISRELVKIAKKRSYINRVESQTDFEVMSVHKLLFPAESFDLVYGLSLLHHVDITKCIPEVKRVLKKGGMSVFSEPIIISHFVEAIRKKVPVPIDDDPSFPAPPLQHSDIKWIMSQFSEASVRYYRLFESLDRVSDNRNFIRIMQLIDQLCLPVWPINKLARQIVIQLRGPS
ncbi:hypothetical protein PITCH_A400049 [uncultured Desulfobacterium sp.]|uniref:Methyltransferase type 11 domain-containing protein n=1 Tax=uncultured Desulfobacterium sp. TaxID=201089 RepID=A0A445MZU6_9BACT|nr:hypothetical protein PITCH_A400049 [uncultured Desulfobacterium sp.]